MRKGGWIVLGLFLLSALMFSIRGGLLRAEPARDEPGGVRPQPGETCTVYLRGDASGAVFHDRIPDLGNLISRHGAFENEGTDWIVLKSGEKRYYIPRQSILLIETGGKPAEPTKAREPDSIEPHKLDLR